MVFQRKKIKARYNDYISDITIVLGFNFLRVAENEDWLNSGGRVMSCGSPDRVIADWWWWVWYLGS